MASEPRCAATLVVVRDASQGIETLLLRRATSADHTSGAWVFPGGIVDARDASLHALCAGLDDADASRRLGLERGGLDHCIAAVRECFEEAGLLFAVDAEDRLVAFDAAADKAPRRNALGTAPTADAAGIAAWREPVHGHQRTLAQLCDTFGLRLAPDRLVYLSHWVTPLGRARRFDTRFFVAEAPAGQRAAFDGTELLEEAWLRPAEAVARAGELALLPPTLATLRLLARFDHVDALLGWARQPREIAMTLPRDGIGRQGSRVVLPDEPAFAELGCLDPQGLGNARYDIAAETPVRLSPRVIRVTAANASVMTGPGTNTYLIGGASCGAPWAVLDPGPIDAGHIDAIVAAAPGPIGWIFVTHTHHDHSPGAARLKARTGAPVLGRRPDHAEWQDETFAPDVLLQGGERFELPGPDGASTTTLQVIHTPGHASNHLCYRLVEENLLFTGDHLMQASSVVINPPDGDMRAYLASLRELAACDLDWLAPGHGFLIDAPRRAIEAVIAHRLRREAKVIEALRASRSTGPADAEALLARVYDDVLPGVLGMAMRSLLAHLLKLRDDGVAVEHEGRWALA